MMADFVDDNMGDQMLKRVSPFCPFIEDRTAEQLDGRWHIARLWRLANGATRIEARQLEGVFNLQFRQQRRVGKILNQDGDTIQMAAKWLGQAAERQKRQPFYVDECRGQLTFTYHACDIGPEFVRGKTWSNN